MSNKVVIDLLLVIIGSLIIAKGILLWEESHDHTKPLVWTGATEKGLRLGEMRVHCYGLPYTREQLKKIEKAGKKEREEFNKFLTDLTLDEDLDELINPPKVIFDNNVAMLCLELKNSIIPDRKLVFNRII